MIMALMIVSASCGKTSVSNCCASPLTGPPQSAQSTLPRGPTLAPPEWKEVASFATSTWVLGAAPATSGAQVWFFGVDSRGEALYEVSASGRVQSWVLIAGVRYNPDDDTFGLVVGPRAVWLGLAMNLFRVIPATGSVEKWRIPSPPPATRAPPSSAVVTGLALGPSGSVAISIRGSSGVEMFHPATQRFSSVLMPASDDEVQAVAYASDGALAAAFYDYGTTTDPRRLLLVRGSKEQTIDLGLTMPLGLSALPSGELVVAGGPYPEIVDRAGRVQRLERPKGLLSPPMPLLVLPRHRLAGYEITATRQQAVVVFPVRSGAAPLQESTAYLLPELPCSQPPSPVASAPSTATTAKDCTVGIQGLAIDSLGDLWLTSGTPKPSVWLLKANQW